MLADLVAASPRPVQLLPRPFGLGLHLGRLGGERFLFDRAAEVALQQALLHLVQFGQAFAGLADALFPQNRLVVAGRGQVAAEPVAPFVVGDAEARQVLLDGFLELILPPADHRVSGVGFEVPAAVVDVLVDVAVLHLADDAFAGDPVAAVGADEHASGQVVVGVAHAAVLALEQVLASLEHFEFDDGLVLTGVGLPSEGDHADVEPVVEDVRQRRAVEARATGLVGETLALEHVGDVLEGVEPGLVQLEDALDGQGVDRVGLDGFIAVALHVLVAVGREARCPALADLLLDALEHLGAEVVGVVLGDGGHDVERQRPGRTGSELVVDEREFHPALVFQFLHPHRVAHVAAGAVELVGEDEVDLQLAGVGSHPLEHLVERHAFGPALGRLGHDELAGDAPALLPRPLAGHAELGVDGVALPLLPRRDACPDYAVLHHRLLLAWTSTSARFLTFMRISTASPSVSSLP